MKYFALLAALVGCDGGGSSAVERDQAVAADAARDAGAPPDAAAPDAAALDAALVDAAAPDAAPDASLAAEPCPRDDEGRCDVVGWVTSATAYPVAVDHHTTLIARDGEAAWLNVFGGILSDDLGGARAVYDTVRRAPVAGDEVGPFEDEPPLPEPKAFHAQIVVQDQVFLLGGITQDDQGPGASTSWLAGRLAGGRVVEWRRGELPREARVHPTGEVLGSTLYLIGGTGSAGAVLDTVRTATLGPDGLPGPFEEAPALPAPRSHHASVVVGGRILVVGGFTAGQATAPEVLRSVHAPDGTLTGWEVVGVLADPPWTSSAVVHRGWLWLVGGGEGEGAAAHFVNTVRGAPLDPEGRPGAFEIFERPLPLARSHVHQTPIHAGFIYSVGGRIAAGGGGLQSTNRVLVGELW